MLPTTLAISDRLGRLLNGLPAVRITKITSVCVANDSMNQTLMRSINTSLITLLPVGSLLIVGSLLLGADTLKDLALALFIGIASGTYSSIFVATPILSIWKEKEPRYASVRDKVLKGTPAVVPAGAAKPATGKSVAAAQTSDGNGQVGEVPLSGEGQPGPTRRVTTQTRPTARVQQRKSASRAKRKKGRR